METPTPRFRGTPVEIGGTRYIVPALSVGAMERWWDLITGEIMNQPEASSDPRFFLRKVAEFCYEALKRNYPELTLEQVKELVDFDNAAEIIDGICRASKLIKKNPGGPTPESPSTGTG